MTVDLRAIVACDLGPIISGSVGSNHISDRSGLEMLSGRLTLDGLYSPARGTAINLLVACPQLGRITRFPKVLRVIRSTSYPLDNRTEVEVGCRLTLLKELKQQEQYFPGSGAISAQAVLTYCLSRLGITMAAGSPTLSHQLLRSSIDLSGGYVRVIGDLIRSECAFGRLRPDETFEVVPISLAIGGAGPVLTADDLVAFEPITTGSEPPDQYRVTYSAVERRRGTVSTGSGGGTGTGGTGEGGGTVTPEPPEFPELTPEENQAVIAYWTKSETYSAPTKTTIRYTMVAVPSGQQPQERTVTYTARSWTGSYTLYDTIKYYDENGKEQRSEVAIQKVDVRYAPVHAVNASFVMDLLKFNIAVDPSEQVLTISTTYYQYAKTQTGPKLIKERTVNQMTEMEFAGGLGISTYVGAYMIGKEVVYYVAYRPSITTPQSDGAGGLKFLVNTTTETVVEYESIDVYVGESLRPMTRTFTSRWLSRGLTQEGQQEFAMAIKNRQSNTIFNYLVPEFLDVKYEGTEVQVSVGKPAVPQRPPAQVRAAAVISQGVAAITSASQSAAGNRGTAATLGALSASTQSSDVQKTVTGTVLFTAGQPSNSITTTATYDMPFAPDDLVAAGTAITAAHRFGQTEAALDVGHAYGYNIVTSFDRIPTLHMAPLYVRLAGLEAAFLTDSLSYAFDASGLVVSSDLMLLGTTGYYGASPPISSWVRLPVPVAGLQAAGAATTEASPAKANSIGYPNGFDPLDPAAAFAALGTTGADVFAAWKAGQHLIGPTVALDAEALATGPVVDAIDYAYALNAGTDVASLATGPVSEFAWVTTIAAPAAGVSVAGLAPKVSTGARVVVPAAAVTLAGAVPAISSGASVAAPTAAVVLAGVAPDLVGRQKTIVNVPAAAVAVAGQVPAVRRGAAVVVPAAGVAVAGVVPTIYDSDALKYVNAVELADGQSLEPAVVLAIDAFVRGCKADGTWAAIKSSCILAGARTLSGALVPLKGTAPTNNGFVSGDYDRKTGLAGNGSSKYLDSNRANNADPQDSQHLAVRISSAGTVSLGGYIGDLTTGQSGYSYLYRNNSGPVLLGVSRTSSELLTSLSIGSLVGVNRSASGSFTIRSNGSQQTASTTSATPSTGNIHVFRLNRSSGNFLYTDARLSFYSIGESITLSSLDSRVATLMSAYGSAIA